MNPFKAIGRFFRRIGQLIANALAHAELGGLTDDVLKLALTWVRVAATKFVDNAEKREFVVAILVKRGIPDSISRLAVELAVQLLKKELGKLPA